MVSFHISQPVALLPKGWTRHVRSGLLHAISLATAAWTVAHSRAEAKSSSHVSSSSGTATR